MWKYIHKGPVAKLSLNRNKLASGGSDSVIRIWDLEYQACVLALKGMTVKIITILEIVFVFQCYFYIITIFSV